MKYLKTYETFSLYNKLFGNDKKEDTTSGSFQEIKFKENSENVGKLQKNLDILGFKLYRFGIDNKYGSETAGKIKSLFDFIKSKPDILEYVDDDKQQLLDFDVDDKVVTTKQVAIIDELANNSDVKTKIANHFKEMEKSLGDELIGKKEIMKNVEDPEAFMTKLNEICKKLEIPNINWLLLIFFKESGINSHRQNKDSGATGLIQFMKKTAEGLGTSLDALKNMTAVEQLDYVYKYFKPYTGKIHSVQDLYLITFFPIAVGKSDDNVLQSNGLSAGKVAKANPGIDLNHDGKITNGEFDDYVMNKTPNKWKDLVNKNDNIA